MLSLFTRLALVAAIIAGTAHAQFREDAYPATTNDPDLVDVEGRITGFNTQAGTYLYLTVYDGTLPFGSGTVVLVDSSSDEDVVYATGNYVFTYVVDWVWGAWVIGLGDLTFYAEQI